jgi:hypothetical protein
MRVRWHTFRQSRRRSSAWGSLLALPLAAAVSASVLGVAVAMLRDARPSVEVAHALYVAGIILLLIASAPFVQGIGTAALPGTELEAERVRNSDRLSKFDESLRVGLAAVLVIAAGFLVEVVAAK